MPAKLAFTLETILEKLFHQRLGIGECNQTVAQVPRRNDAKLLAQASRGTTVIRNRDNRRNIRCRRLDAAQQNRKPVPTADDSDARAAAETSFFIDDVNEPLAAVRQQHKDDGANDKAHRNEHERKPYDDDGRSDQRRKHIVIRTAPKVDRAENRFFNRVEILIVEDERKSQPCQHDADREEEQPSFEAQPRIEPFQKMHLSIPPERVPAHRSS